MIDTDAFLEAAFGDERDTKAYQFAIRSLSAEGAPSSLLYGSAKLFDMPGAELLTSDVPGGKWQYAILSTRSNSTQTLLLTARAISYLLSLLLGVAVYAFLRDRAKLTEQAMYDSLTGLANRRLLQDRMHQIMSRIRRTPDAFCALVFFDLNGFKKINDRFGHKVGDVVLSTIAQRIRTELRGSDTIARLGGDEFVIVVEQGTRKDIEQMEQRLRTCVAEPIPFEDGFDLRVSAAVGVSYYPEDGDNCDMLLKAADHRMYEDKRRIDR